VNISSENTQKFILKLKHDKLRQYTSPNKGMDFRDEIVVEDYITYNSFLKTSIFHSIARNHIVPKPIMFSHNSVS
jgi:hypothetical protein